MDSTATSPKRLSLSSSPTLLVFESTLQNENVTVGLASEMLLIVCKWCVVVLNYSLNRHTGQWSGVPTCEGILLLGDLILCVYRRRRFLSTGAYRDNSDKMGA